MKLISKGILFGALILCQSCATTALWENTDPNQRIWIPADKTSEAALQKKGVEHEFHAYKCGQGYTAEKTKWRKIQDINLRVIGTPVALALDASMGVAYVTAGVGYLILSDPYLCVEVLELVECAVNH